MKMIRQVKVYSDGSHYVGIPYVPHRYAGRKKGCIQEEKIEVKNIPMPEKNGKDEKERASFAAGEKMTRKEIFEALHEKYKGLQAKARKKLIVQGMLPYFQSEDESEAFAERQMKRKKRNEICRKIRLWRKLNMNNFNYFVTFTYSDELHTEESFRKALGQCLQHYSSRKGWRYIGVWERSEAKKRLHFHGIFRIPEGTLPGENTEKRDYDTRDKRMRTRVENSYFAERFGRNDFEEIASKEVLPLSVRYITKYMEKTGEKLVYSRGLYQYFVADIPEEDVVFPMGEDGKKLLLFDDFACWKEGEYIGRVSEETIAKLPKRN